HVADGAEDERHEDHDPRDRTHLDRMARDVVLRGEELVVVRVAHGRPYGTIATWSPSRTCSAPTTITRSPCVTPSVTVTSLRTRSPSTTGRIAAVERPSLEVTTKIAYASRFSGICTIAERGSAGRGGAARPSSSSAVAMKPILSARSAFATVASTS